MRGELCFDSESERAASSAAWRDVVASPRACAVCGAVLTGRPQQKCCSARCRAAWSRRRPVELQAEPDQRVRELLETAIRVLARVQEPVT
jgi:hypothetical protein